MLLYLLKSTICLALLFTFYKVFLERESFHQFKRLYLIGSLLAAFIIPSITFTEYVEIPMVSTTTYMQSTNASDVDNSLNQMDYLSPLLWTIYAFGLFLLASKLGRNLLAIIRRIKRNPHLQDRGTIHVLIREEVIPHTFLRYVFFNKQRYQKHMIPSEVLEHEAAHARQFHTIDLLLIEILKVLFWFNPLIYWMRNSIKLNHEFLADEAVLKKGANPHKYQEILLAFSSNVGQPELAHSINYSSFKKRFLVMKTRTSPRRKALKFVILIPLLALLIYGFSSTEKVVRYAPSEQQKATPEQVSQYNSMAQFWNQRFAETAPERSMPLSELSTLETLYNTMSESQRENANPFPVCNPAGKMISLWIQGFNIKLNNETVSLAEFASTINRITANWSIEDFENSSMQIKVGDSKPGFMKKLENEYQKTKLYKVKKNKLIPPPPPPPPAPPAPSANKEVPEAPAPPPVPEDGGLPRMGVMIINLPSVGPNPDLSNPKELIEYIDELGLPFYHDMKKITKKEALEIALKHRLEIQWQPHADEGEPMMIFTNGC